MTVEELIKYATQLKRLRATMYLSKDKMEQWYLQKMSQIMEWGSGQALSGNIEASLLGLFKSGAGGEKTSAIKIDLKNETVQAVIAENAARASGTLVFLSTTRPPQGELCYYLGTARTILPGTDVTPENTELNADECATTNAVRSRQEEILKLFDASAKTAVLSFRANDCAYAAICSLKHADADWLTSYADEKHFGILCTLESIRDNVIFLDPIWIWHE
jgi:hypothetical protein